MSKHSLEWKFRACKCLIPSNCDDIQYIFLFTLPFMHRRYPECYRLLDFTSSGNKSQIAALGYFYHLFCLIVLTNMGFSPTYTSEAAGTFENMAPSSSFLATVTFSTMSLPIPSFQQICRFRQHKILSICLLLKWRRLRASRSLLYYRSIFNYSYHQTHSSIWNSSSLNKTHVFAFLNIAREFCSIDFKRHRASKRPQRETVCQGQSKSALIFITLELYRSARSWLWQLETSSAVFGAMLQSLEAKENYTN